jgi:hypothetical protein
MHGCSPRRTGSFIHGDDGVSGMTLAERTREAADGYPFLVEALRAGVVNYSAAARFLDVGGDDEAVATALRRYADALPGYETTSRSVRVTMQSGIDRLEAASDALLTVNGTAYGVADGGTRTAILANGTVDAAFVRRALGLLSVAGVDVAGLGFGSDVMVVVVDRLTAANALRAVEAAAERVES